MKSQTYLVSTTRSYFVCLNMLLSFYKIIGQTVKIFSTGPRLGPARARPSIVLLNLLMFVMSTLVDSNNMHAKCVINNMHAKCVFIYLKKPFDTVDHRILVDKLDHYGVRGVAKQWLSSYLGTRKQYVCFNGMNSSYSTVTCGVPQGSILGPTLFIMYVNDICNVSSHLKSILFADDTSFFVEGSDWLEMCQLK